MKTVTIPFDLELAKKIQNGKVEGKIVDDYNNEYEIVKYDAKGIFPLIGVYFNEETSSSFTRSFTIEGRYSGGCPSYDLQLVIPEYLTWKDGDYLTITSNSNKYLFIFKSYIHDDLYPIKTHAIYMVNNYLLCNDEIRISNDDSISPSTPFEIAKLTDALLKGGKAWNPETKQIEDIETAHTVEKRILKPFDRVLVRDDLSNKWDADLYSYMEGDIFCCISNYWNYCIPYEGNEHLLGTTNNPEE